jgi:FkbM family methyltransferase
MQLHRLGTKYGGWEIPLDIELNENSIIYSGGVGEDISFDVLLQSRYKSTIVLIDPTVRSFAHYDAVQNFYDTGDCNFTGIQNDYISTIQSATPDFSKFLFVKKGLWSEEAQLKFFKPVNEKYVSSTLIKNMYSDNYTIVQVDSIKNIMASLGHTYIDMLKLDIEGSEIVVLNRMLDDKIYPKYICVEFDLKLKRVDYDGRTEALMHRLVVEGYELKNNSDYNCLYVRLF